MKLEDLYDLREIPSSQRIKCEKNIVLVVPEGDEDISWFLSRTGLDRCEVAVTWPKDGLDLVEEVSVFSPKLVIQLVEKFSKRFPYVEKHGEVSDKLQSRINDAVADKFVCYHHHDEFSLKDGLGTVGQLTKLLQRRRQSFCSITNHGSVGGWVKQYNACKKAGIKPIFGIEMYVSDYRGDDPELKKQNRSANHLILLAKNQLGFDNIIRIHNDAQLEGFYYSPRMNHEAAQKWGKGIIATSACSSGEIAQALMEDDFEKARYICEFYTKCFDEFYIELQIIEFETQREVNRRLIKFAQEMGAPMTLACDSHYLDPSHADTHDLLMYIRQGKTLLDVVEKDEDVWDFEVRNLFYRNDVQMREVFENGFLEFSSVNKRPSGERPPFKDEVFTEEVFNDAMANTLAIARKIDHIEMDSSIKLPKLYPDSKEYLRNKANEGFKRLNLHKKPNKKEYIDRLRYEFEVICRLGWADYFLVMERIVEVAKNEFYDEVGEFALGYGRGSAAGSLLSWCLGLTECDPLEHGLLFERFLDESRSSVSACSFEF
jgi:DNA polymerase-3 subunit alpha